MGGPTDIPVYQLSARPWFSNKSVARGDQQTNRYFYCTVVSYSRKSSKIINELVYPHTGSLR